MSPSPPGRKAIWLLPIVIAICAVMVLPAGTFVASSGHAGNPMAAAAGLAATPARPASSLPAAPTPPGNIATPPSPSGSPGPSALSSAAPASSNTQLTATHVSTGTKSFPSNIPASYQNLPWLRSAYGADSTGYLPTASVPNPLPLEHAATPVNGVIYPAEVAQPAPLGLADYGLGVTPYSYNTSHIMGQVTFNAAPNATQPSAAFVINPTSVGEREGYVGSEYEFGLQLNTIGINLTIPGTDDQGYVWAQNVVNWNASGIHFIQDTWNFSAYADTVWGLNSIYSGCGGNESYANYILELYGYVLQCSEGNIPISAADYPVTLSLYNNFTTNSAERSQLVYGYSLYEAGSGTTLSGAFTVVFNNPDTSVAPANTPANSINPYYVTPTLGPDDGWWQDAEMVIVGGIEGDNAVFSSINGSVNLEYSNATSGGWKNVPSAYNFGTDTGETSTGIADYWTPSHTLEINQGPAMLYGLWNAETQSSVASGDIHIAGTISPSYGFVFVSNTPPVLNPWGGTERDNMSWLPANSAGDFSTYLPPLGAPWTTTYYVQAFAAGSMEYNGTVTGSTTTLAISLTAAPGVIRAPLYMSTTAQASALAVALGAAVGPPYTFTDLVVNVNFTFDHLNEYDFPSFEMFQSAGVNSVVVNDLSLGTDSVTSGNSYILDYAAGYVGDGLLVPAPSTATDVPYYTQGVNVFYGSGDLVENQVLFLIYGGIGEWGGSQITLWSDTDAAVNDTLSIDEIPGVWIGNSLDTAVTDIDAIDAYGVTELGSTGTHVTSLLVDDGAVGILAIASVDATYHWVNVTDDSVGIVAGSDEGFGPLFSFWGAVGLTVNNLNVTEDSLGANVTFSSDTTFNSVLVNDPSDLESQGIDLDGASHTTVNYLTADYGSAFYVWNATGLTFNYLVIEYGSVYYWNSQVYYATGLTFNTPFIYDVYYNYDDESYSSLGVVGWYDSGITVSDALVEYAYGGMIFAYSSDFTGTSLSSIEGEFSYELDFSTAPISVSGVSADDSYIGLNLYNTYPATVSDVDAFDFTGSGEYYGGGLAMYNDTGNKVSDVTANEATGVKIDSGGSGNSVNGVLAEYSDEETTVGVFIESSNSNTVTDVVAQDDAVGVEIDPSSGDTVSGVTATYGSAGVYVEESTDVSVATVAPTEFSVGVWSYESNDIALSGITDVPGSIGAIAEDSQFVTISGVTATGTAPVLSPFAYAGIFGIPAAAVDTYESVAVTITNVTVTDFPAALYDAGSSGLTVTALNATGGYYAAVLNGTSSSLFTGIGAFMDYQGILMEDGVYANTVTGSSFVDDTSYGVAITNGSYNTVYNNDFIGDNGATSTYSPSNIQAFAVVDNDFYLCANYDCSTGVGNYWADWHTYGSNGYLAPYWLSGASVDEFPIGPQETFLVSFAETGLAAGTSWSVTLSGMTETSTTPFVNFTVPMGSYVYAVSSVSGYTASPTGGVITQAGATYSVAVAFTQTTYAVTLSASGLSAGTSWGATVNGVSQSTTGTTLVFYLPAGTAYKYSFNAVSGYNLPTTGASGTFNVSTEPVSLATTYSPTSTPSYVQTSDFDNWFAVAIAIAVIALVIGLLALLLRGRKEQPPPQGAQPWTPPPAQSGSAPPPAAGGSSSWSEGPSSGGPPPS